MRRARALLGTMFLLGVSAPSVLGADLLQLSDAEEAIKVPGAGTVNVWIGGGYFNAPVANGLGTVADDEFFNFVNQSENGVALADVGFDGGFSVWAPASEVTVYTGFNFEIVRSSSNYNVDPGAALFIDALPINGAPSPESFFITQGADGVDSATEIGYRRVSGAIGLGMPEGRGVNVAIGVLASSALLDFSSTVSNPTYKFQSLSLSETVDMLSGGLMIAAQMDTDVSEGVELSLRGRVALLYATAELEASQTSVFGLVEVTDTAGEVSGLLEAQTAVNFDIAKGVVLSITGGLDARNDYFSIVNPRSGPGLDANDGSSYDPGSAFLEQAMVWNAKIGVGLTGSF